MRLARPLYLYLWRSGLLAAGLVAACSGTPPPTVSLPASLPPAATNTAPPLPSSSPIPSVAAVVSTVGPTTTSALSASSATTSLAVPTTYTVMSGDTIWSIAQRFGLPLQRLINSNPGLNPNLLHIGDVLRIPGSKDVLATPPDASARVRIDGGGLRLRETPTLTGAVLGYLDALTRLTLVGRTADGTWLQVVTPTGQGGWVTTAWTDVYVAMSQVPIVNPQVAATATAASVASAAPASPSAAVPANAGTVAPVVNPGGYNTISGISPHARQVFAQGQKLGNRPDVFSKVGDSITSSAVFLFPIGSGEYNLREYARLQPVIDYFAAQPARGSLNSFANPSLAAKVGWRARAVITLGSADPAACRPDESPLECEYRLVRPSLALIMLGTNDVVSTPDDQFEADMRQVLEFTLSKGIVPVLSTIPPLFRTGLDGRAEQLNVILVRLARAYDIPLWDYWSALQALPNSGMGTDGVHPNWAPAGHNADFNPADLQYGMVVRNLTALYVLDAVWRQVLQP